MVWKNNLRYKYFEYREVDETTNTITCEFRFADNKEVTIAEYCFHNGKKSCETKREYHPHCYSFQNEEGHTILRYLSGVLDYEYYQHLGNYENQK